jgi:hypothetical protein
MQGKSSEAGCREHAAAQEAGVEFYVVEQDHCRRPHLESVAISLKNLCDWGVA